MSLAGYGFHDTACTLVHFSDGIGTYDYCLVCRGRYFCFAAVEASTCTKPVARRSEEDSRDSALRMECDHPDVLHYQEPSFTPDEFWADKARRYHYCAVCRRYTCECPDSRQYPGSPTCSRPHTDVPLDDSDYVARAWLAADV